MKTREETNEFEFYEKIKDWNFDEFQIETDYLTNWKMYEILKYGLCSMQGWRRTMEDTHLIKLNVGTNNNTHIFGIFDGHGGREVANYVKNHFTDIFLNSEKYKKGNIKDAIKETYLQLDKNLETKEAMKELTIDHFEFNKQYKKRRSISKRRIKSKEKHSKIIYGKYIRI